MHFWYTEKGCETVRVCLASVVGVWRNAGIRIPRWPQTCPIRRLSTRIVASLVGNASWCGVSIVLCSFGQYYSIVSVGCVCRILLASHIYILQLSD